LVRAILEAVYFVGRPVLGVRTPVLLTRCLFFEVPINSDQRVRGIPGDSYTRLTVSLGQPWSPTEQQRQKLFEAKILGHAELRMASTG